MERTKESSDEREKVLNTYFEWSLLGQASKRDGTTLQGCWSTYVPTHTHAYTPDINTQERTHIQSQIRMHRPGTNAFLIRAANSLCSEFR